MVYNSFIKCDVCGAVTRIRLQVGWLPKHPIEVACGKCGITLSGEVEIDQNNVCLYFHFQNASILSEIVSGSDYVVECSGEFPSIKQVPEDDGALDIITPFFRNLRRFENQDCFEEFCENIKSLRLTSDRWPQYERIFALYRNGNTEYFMKEISKVLPSEYSLCRNGVEMLRAIHLMEVYCFISPLRKDVIQNAKLSHEIMTLDLNQLQGLISYLNNHDGYSLQELQDTIFSTYTAFTRIYGALLPTYAGQYFKDGINYMIEGSTTSSYESVKEFYIDTYETLGNLLVIPVALNNIKYRGDYNSLDPSVDKGGTLDDFIGKTKANRFRFCTSNEKYTDLLKTIINPKLRNAIGHKDVKYNSITQEIVYVPNPKDRSKKFSEYLLEFENEEMHLFQAVLVISEYLYQLMKLELIQKASFTKLYLSVKKQKIGRNVPCPCGSGKKYKQCCGRAKRNH